MSTDSALGKGLNVMTLGLYNPVMKALFPGQKSPDANINTDPGQTSTYGAFITRTHGTIGQSGNIIWLEKNKLKAVVKKAKKSGKGGGAPAATATVTYFATFAVALCEGPIAGVRRIWVGPDLIYDAGSDDLESIIASNKALKNFKIYLGTDTQTPNARIQADRGAANTPAYPGLAYIVVTDLALAKYGNSIQGAQVKVEVFNSADTVGFRSILNTPSAITYYQYGTPGAGTPYIVSADSYAIITSPSTSSIVSATGSFAMASAEKKLTEKTGNLHYCGYLADGSELSVLVTGSAFLISDTSLPLEVDMGLISGRKIHALTVSGNGEYIFALFSAAESGSSFTDGIFYLLRGDGTHIKHGLTYGVSLSRSTFGFGRSAQNGYSASCVKNDGSKVYCALGYGSYEIFEFEINDLLENKISYPLAIASSLPFNRPSIIENNDILYVIACDRYYQFALNKKASMNSVWLSSLIQAETARSALISPLDIDTSGMADSVIGYRITAAGSIRNALEPLRAAFPFDAYQSGYKIRFRSRGTGSVATIPIGHLIADTQLEESREMDSQLPQRVTVQYLDRDRDYDQNEQSEERLGAESVNEQNVSVQVVMTAAHAKQTAEKLLYLAWLERSSYNFKLPPIYSGLESSDVITIVAEFASYELRLVSASPNSDGLISCSGVPGNAAIYTSAATGDEGQQAPVTIPLAGASVAVLLDVPVVDETVQNAPGFVAAMTGYTGGWAGGTIVRSADEGQTWDDVQGFGEKGTFGYAQAPLAANAGNLVQRGGSLTVSLLSGFVDGVTEAQMFGGSNTAAYGAHGRWEIIRFQNATLNPDGSYTLDTLWRGDKGTEWATGMHQAGDLFVLLNDPDNAFIGMSQDSIGQPRTYRAVTFGAEIDSASDIPFTYAGVNLECLSPAHPEGVRDGSANLTASWKRRTRVGGAWRDYVDASLGETSEAYEIDVMSGTTVKRTLTSATQSVIYTAANQVTDFGSAQSSITLRIYQLSSVVGRGYPLETTL